jgi:hypothetical protein
VSYDRIEDLLKRVTPAKPANGSRDRVLSEARERAAQQARTRYNVTLEAAIVALVVIIVAGFVLDQAASRRLERLIYSPVAKREVVTVTTELARALAETLDGDDSARIEEYLARFMHSSGAGRSFVGRGTGADWHDTGVEIERFMEDEYQWNGQAG